MYSHSRRLVEQSPERHTEERAFPGSEVRDYRMNFSLKLPFPSRITIRHIVSTRRGKAPNVPREHRELTSVKERKRKREKSQQDGGNFLLG